jgi:predicted type IV restriction endonuclease
MVQTAVTQVIKTLNHVHQKFGLQRATDNQFFTEWFEGLPQLTTLEQETLDLIRQRFRYHREEGQVTEGAVNEIVVSRLMELAGFYDPPFRLRSELPIEITTTVETETLRGRIDFLVVQERFWCVIIESKETEFDIEVGIPQTLAYAIASSAEASPLFGMVTNGNSFIFIKIDPQNKTYDFSETYSMLSRTNHLYDVLQILKAIATIFLATTHD